MPGELHVWRLSMSTFQAFRDERPKEEKWELIDGRPTMMAPPSRMHQRICSNLENMFNAQLAATRSEWRADREVGVLFLGDEKYNPEPDVLVTDTEIAIGEIFAERFYAVVEVLSPGDKAWVVELKLQYYQGHEPCRAILFVEQDRVGCDLWRRVEAVWTKSTLSAAMDRLDLPDIGDIGALGDAYRHTPLWAGG